MKKLLPILLCLSLLTGCSGGSVYLNYREPELLTVIQSMGFDTLGDGGVMLSVSSGANGSTDGESCLSASAESVTAARARLSDYSASEELFFAHTAYFAVGEQTAKTGLAPYFDYIARVPDLRLDEPMFVVSGATANELLTGASGKEHDAASIFSSLERNGKVRGDFLIFSVSELIAALDLNGCALMTAIRPERAANAVGGADKTELTALPDGYAVIKHGAMVGRIPPGLAPCVGLLMNRAGPLDVELTVGKSRLTLSLDDCECEFEPVIENGELTAFNVNAEISTALRELDGAFDSEAAEKALAVKLRGMLESVLGIAKTLRCDFLQLGYALERKEPVKLRGLAEDFSQTLGGLQYNVYVTASVTRSFDE